jgi:dipeptidase D
MHSIPSFFPKEPIHLWHQFYQITQCPRPSKKEDKIRDYLIAIAKERKLKSIVDSAGNVVIYVPATQGYEDHETVIIQNHIDMVTDAVSGLTFDFETQPIQTEVVDGWLKAKGTTLGADNGIGCAAALATLFETDIVHPPLELLFTTDEETGLNGALGLERKYLSGKVMLNLDTEEWGSLYIGCAGGIDYDLQKTYLLEETDRSLTQVKVEIKGLLGGHSGVEIHEQRANAIKILNQLLLNYGQENDFNLLEMRAGRAHNIIPREAFVILRTDNVERLQKLSKELISEVKGYLPADDQGLMITISKDETNFKGSLSQKDSLEFSRVIALFPHGVHSYDLATNREIVATSNNLAKALLVNGKAYFLTSLRFFDRHEIKSIESQLNCLAGLFDFKITHNSEYPSWKPSRENKLLDKVSQVYKNTFGQEAHITAIHAGLECGILRDKIGDIDVVSFGPTIKGAHSPDERVEIESVAYFWKLFKQVLKEL